MMATPARCPLNTFADEAFTSSWDKLFQQLTTCCEKNWRRHYNNSDSLSVSSSDWWLHLTVSSDLRKNSFHGVAEKTFTNLNNSVRSILLRLPSRDHRPSCRSLSLHGKLWHLENKLLKRCRTCSSSSMSFRAPIVATWADRFSRCCWRRFSWFLKCPLTLSPVPASHCLSSLLHAIAAA